jgi:hypothetical protein
VWIVVDPKYSTQDGAKVVRVQVDFFPDHIDYEGILGRAFQEDEFREWRDGGGIVILATEAGYAALQKTMEGAVDVTERAVVEETTKLALERQVVVLRWVADASA